MAIIAFVGVGTGGGQAGEIRHDVADRLGRARQRPCDAASPRAGPSGSRTTDCPVPAANGEDEPGVTAEMVRRGRELARAAAQARSPLGYTNFRAIGAWAKKTFPSSSKC